MICFEKEKNYQRKISQNKWLPIILWLFPLILLNLGCLFFYRIDQKWIEEEQTELAKQDVESLAANSEFSYCFSKLAGEFGDELKKGAKSCLGNNYDKLFLAYIKSRAEYKFREPFPEHELLVFKIQHSNQKSELIYSNIQNVRNKRALGIVFEYLVKVNSQDPSFSEEKRKKGADITKNIWGGETDPEVVAETQRGKTSFSFYKRIANRFFWDYFVDAETKNVYGYFLVVDADKDIDNAAKLIALRELRYSQQKNTNKKLGAFIPLFPGCGGVVAQEEVEKLPGFKEKIRKWVPSNSKEIFDWQKNIIPFTGKDALIENYQAHFHVAPGQSHAAVLFIPLSSEFKFPLWITVTNCLIIVSVIYLLFRGIVYGIWPQTSLKVRFISTYFLAACLPLGLLIIASYGYLTEYRHTELFKNQAKLRKCINQFDSNKTRLQDGYKTAFFELQSDAEMSKAFKKLETASSEFPQKIIPEAKEVLDKAMKVFNRNGRNFPILSLTVIDEFGGFLCNLGNDTCPYYIDSKHTEYIEDAKSLSYEKKRVKKINDNVFEALIYPLILSLRNRIEVVAPDKKKWTAPYKITHIQKAVAGSFKAAAGNNAGSLSEEFDRRRNLISFREVGDMTVGNIHNYIFVDGIPRFIVFVLWDAGSLDEKAFKSTLSSFAISEPNLVFSAFKTSDKGIEPWLNSGRHGKDFEKTSYNVANQAFFRKGNASIKNDSVSVLAMHSKSFLKTILTGGVSHDYMSMPMFVRLCMLGMIFIVALIILFACIYYSAKIFLKPISNLKKSLEEVSAGNFDISIKGSGKDEFGVLSNEFSEMTRGLNERNKLATLISDHAIEALSKNKSDEKGISDVETFSGVALVSDIRNFTGLCETHAPDQITELLNEHFARMTKIISEHGGRIYKYIGDAVEVVFADEDNSLNTSSERALKAAFYMINCLRIINEERKQKGLFTYKIGIGLCYGQMSSGTIGSLDTRLDYAIIGDTLKQAAKLENLTKLHQEFPLVVNRAFVKEINKTSILDFKKILEIEKNGLNEECFYISETEVVNFVDLKNKNNKASIVSQETSDDKEKTNKNISAIMEVKEKFSFSGIFVPGFVFITILFFILFAGSFLVWETEKNIEKNQIMSDNEREFSLITCDDYGKVAFDFKARIFAKALDGVLSKLDYEDISDEIIDNTLCSTFEKDSSIQDKEFNFAFIRAKDNSDYILSSDTAFIDGLQLSTVCSRGYSREVTDKISDSFRICEALNILENNSRMLNLSETEKEAFQKPYLLYMKEFYGEPSRKIFGERAPITDFKSNPRNSSIDGTMDNKFVYYFWLDFYAKQDGKEKLLGYFICSMPVDKSKDSIDFLLSAYSNKEHCMAFKNKSTNTWEFSANFPDYLKEGIIASKTTSTKRNENLAKEYLDSLGVISSYIELTIGNIPYDVLFVSICSETVNLWALTLLVFAFIGLILFLVGLSSGKSFVSHSVAAKLWLALLIVAVVPVVTMFFVYGLYKDEHHSVRTSQEKAAMQEYIEIYESRVDFPSPLIWNFIRKRTNSKELYELVRKINSFNSSEEKRKKALAGLRNLCDSWVGYDENYSKFEKNLINFSITDVSVVGTKGWNFCQSDKVDNLDENKLSISAFMSDKLESADDENGMDSANFVSYADALKDNTTDGIGNMLSLVGKSLLERKGIGVSKSGKVNKEMVAGEIAIETGLKAIRTFLGDDVFVRISHGLNLPTVMDIGMGKLGLYLSPIPDYEKPEFIIIWMINFSVNDYLVRLSNLIDSRYGIFPAVAYRYGEIAHTIDNKWRIPLGELATKMVTTNLPVSSSLNIDKEEYFIEGATSRHQINSLLVLSYSTKEILKELRQMNWLFSLLLLISVFIIFYTTKNIAADILIPLNNLIAGIKEIKNENFTYRIESDRVDELGVLCNSFDQMAKGLEEKHLMSKMVSKTARMVTLKEMAETSRKTDCVFLYSAVPDFATLTANSKDVDIFAKLKRYTAVVAGCIMESGGEVDKIMGEKLLAVFRIKNGDVKATAMAACNAAKKLIELEKSDNLSFPIAIGVNYGNVINGFLGVGGKRDFTVIGDAVNVTARIESLSEKINESRCLISESINEQIGSDFVSKFYGEVELKGKSQPMKVYQIV